MALVAEVVSSAHVVNLLHRAAAAAPVAPLQVADALKFAMEPAANCDRYDRLLRSHSRMRYRCHRYRCRY